MEFWNFYESEKRKNRYFLEFFQLPPKLKRYIFFIVVVTGRKSFLFRPFLSGVFRPSDFQDFHYVRGGDVAVFSDCLVGSRDVFADRFGGVRRKLVGL